MKIGRSKARAISEITIDADIDMNSYSITEMGNITLVKNSGIQHLAALVTDGDWCGHTVLATAGEDVDAGEVVYLKSDAKMWLSDADGSTTMPVKAMATEDILADAEGVFLLDGFMRVDAWNWTIGNTLYAHTTPGAMTATPPSASGDIAQRVAIAVTADIVNFRPSKDEFILRKELFLPANEAYVRAGTPNDIGSFGAVEGGANADEPWLNFSMKVPTDFASFVKVEAVWESAAVSGNLYWKLTASYAAAGEARTTHTEDTGFGATATGGTTIINVQEAATRLALTDLAVGDILGIYWGRLGTDALDTLDAAVQFLGLLFTYVAKG